MNMIEKSVANVIPFGDITDRELEVAADIFGVGVDEMYDAGQEPIDIDVMRDDVGQNPKLEGLAENWFSPIANTFIPIAPLAEAAQVVATAKDFRTLQRNLAKVMQKVRDFHRTIKESEWEELETLRIKKHIANRRDAGKEPLPDSVRRRPYSEAVDAYRDSPYWTETKKLINWLSDPARKTPPFAIFTEGSTKLPFFQWSTVPGATCPGAGRCWDANPSPVVLAADGTATRQQHTVPNGAYCYSINGWRNVTPFLRQLQNTVLMRLEDKSVIESALKDIVEDWEKERRETGQDIPRRVVRLYVDGDFDSITTLDYWMHACDRHPEIDFYGYSKSWDIFLAWDRRNGGRWPENYCLNLSSGTLWEKIGGEVYAAMIQRMVALRCTRGRFVAIMGVESHMPKMTKKMEEKNVDPRDLPGHRDHMRDVVAVADANREKYGIAPDAKIVSCPGKCYACGGPNFSGDPDRKERIYGMHMCGNPRVKAVIAIAVHGTQRKYKKTYAPATWEG